jgi:glycosyltransferase involved in cell wall biosynthesis
MVYAMRVLMVTPRLPREGHADTTAFISRQIESLQRLGIDVDTIAIEGASRTKYARGAVTLGRRVERSDLVHAHYGFCGWLARTQRARPVVVSFLGSDLLYYPVGSIRRAAFRHAEIASNRILARLVDRVIVKSDEMARRVGGARPAVIPNGVDLEAFAPRDKSEARRELGWPHEGKLVLFAGNPNQIRKAFPVARAAIEEASALLGQRLDVFALRDIRHEQVATLMNASDVMILTSLAEGSPNVVKEAMACNLPVVSVTVGDVSYLLEGVQGCRVTSPAPRALGEALAEILRDPRRTDGRRALEAKRLDAGSVARRIIGVYEEVLNADGRRVRRSGAIANSSPD